MTTKQAYIEGFVKRASEYGFSEHEALNLLKSASPETIAMSPGALTAAQAGKGPSHIVAPAPPIGVSAWTDPHDALRAAGKKTILQTVSPDHMNDAIMQPGQRSFTSLR